MNNESAHNKTILLVIRHPVGGIRTYFKYIYNNKLFNRYNFIIVLPDGTFTELFRQSINTKNVKFVTTKPNPLSILKAVNTVLRNNAAHLIHSHGYTSGIICSLFARFYSTPHILTAHDVLLEKQFPGFFGFVKKKLICQAIKLIDVIHAVSDDTNRNVQSMLPCLNANRIVTIKNGIDVDQFSKSEIRDFRKELGLATDTFLLGFMGRFMSQKGFKYIIEAVSRLDNQFQHASKIKIIAMGNEGFLKQDREVVQSRGLQNYFIFLPSVGNPASAIKGFDVILMPSLWEACGLVAMEALVSGTPIIASNCIGLREVVRDSPAFTVDPADPDALFSAIITAYNDNRKSEFLNYRQAAAERFDCSETARQLNELYISQLK